jgi:predicted Zn finger-like uncharacterized protein
MRIACPNCSAEYDLPESLLAGGPRLLRCARCGFQFEAALPGPATAAEAAPAVEEEGPPVATPPPGRRLAERLAGLSPPRLDEAPASPADPVPSPPPAAPPPAAAAPALEPASGTPPEASATPSAAPERESPPAPMPEPPPEPPPEPLPEPMPEPMRRAPPAAPPVEEAEPRGPLVAWALSFLLLLAAIWALVSYRADIMAAFPPAIRFYALLGLG